MQGELGYRVGLGEKAVVPVRKGEISCTSCPLRPVRLVGVVPDDLVKALDDIGTVVGVDTGHARGKKASTSQNQGGEQIETTRQRPT